MLDCKKLRQDLDNYLENGVEPQELVGVSSLTSREQLDVCILLGDWVKDNVLGSADMDLQSARFLMQTAKRERVFLGKAQKIIIGIKGVSSLNDLHLATLNLLEIEYKEKEKAERIKSEEKAVETAKANPEIFELLKTDVPETPGLLYECRDILKELGAKIYNEIKKMGSDVESNFTREKVRRIQQTIKEMIIDEPVKREQLEEYKTYQKEIKRVFGSKAREQVVNDAFVSLVEKIQ